MIAFHSLGLRSSGNEDGRTVTSRNIMPIKHISKNEKHQVQYQYTVGL
jgi:hypothetical protein